MMTDNQRPQDAKLTCLEGGDPRTCPGHSPSVNQVPEEAKLTDEELGLRAGEAFIADSTEREIDAYRYVANAASKKAWHSRDAEMARLSKLARQFEEAGQELTHRALELVAERDAARAEVAAAKVEVRETINHAVNGIKALGDERDAARAQVKTLVEAGADAADALARMGMWDLAAALTDAAVAAQVKEQ